MFTKPLNLIIVYILTIINFIVLLAPFGAILFLIIKLNLNFVLSDISNADIYLAIKLLIFAISLVMILYLILDFIFGFSVYSSMKGCKNYKRLKEYQFLAQIFEQVKEKFGKNGVKLYIKDSGEVNAFAIGCMGRKAMVLTTGLIQHTLNNSDDKKEFLLNLRSIMGHEMSHLVNKDYLPTLLIIINQKATNLISRILELMIKIPLTILGYMRFRSRIIFDLMMWVYSIVNRVVIFFNSTIIYNLYEFIRKFVSRSAEYRCDLQSAQAFGGQNMKRALTLFGSNGYFTIFSTHPNTNLRIKHVQNVSRKQGVIHPLISSSIANYFGFMILIIICSTSAKTSGADLMIREYLINSPDALNQYLQYLLNLVAYAIEWVKKLAFFYKYFS